MRLEKFDNMKSQSRRFRDWYRLARHAKHPGYFDKFFAKGMKLPFKNNGAIIGHMIALRSWVIAYAPSDANPLVRMQELHKLHNEMNYLVYRSMWRRAFPIILVMGFLTRKVFKKRYMNKGEDDAFETSWRDTHVTNH